jgi:copper chaperone
MSTWKRTCRRKNKAAVLQAFWVESRIKEGGLAMKTVTLDVRGMSCNHCVTSIEGALNKVAGVGQAKVDLAAGQVMVSFDESAVSLDEVKETVEEQGYDVV